MAGLWAWPLLLWVTFAGERPHALVRKHKHTHRREPCDQAPEATCEEELAKLREELAECQTTVSELEAHSAEEKAKLREEWQAINAQVAEISEQVAAKEAELDQLEAENSALHAELIETLGSIGLLQVNRTDPADETDAWLACLDEKTSVELEASSCKLTIRTTTARMTSQRQHYESLKEAAQQNVNMVTSRLNIVEQMIESASARKLKLTEQVAQVKAMAGTSFAVVGTRQRRGVVEENASDAAAPSAEERAAAHRRAAQEEDPIAEARERLKTIDEEIDAMRKEVELRGRLRAEAREAMGAEAKVQTKVAGKLRKVRAKTMEAFRKAFELDLQLDQLEALHDDAYVAARNATAAWEAAARAEHEAMAELQTLVTQKHRYESIVQRAEDPERLEKAEPAWAREDEEPSRHAFAPRAFAAFALLLAAA